MTPAAAPADQTNKTHVCVVLDKSGSMTASRSGTISGYNEYLNGLRADTETQYTLTLIQFDHEILTTYTDVELKDVVPLTTETFKPRGSTALLDAIGATIKSPKCTHPVVIILTDGQENSSTKFTKAHIKDLIEQKTKDGWTFMYLGANQDAFAEAGAMGIAPACTMNYDANKTPEAFRALSQTVSQRATV